MKKDLRKDLNKLKNSAIAPRFTLWLRVDDTLRRRKSWLTQCYRGLALAATAACAVLVFTGQDYYHHYQLDQYLSQMFVYTPNPVVSEYGTFI
ncbi:hypothetical protein NO1_0827 [Candidatus Termititenax aidoneus]|uniref:Uncharacterized protein n=1 Tax=Termititenax aidoneus TaxID=2218524 RepID=A0A388T9V8_TERA1|nr:hypothetical protein NO1_0827 [Candidatus Termititenax aidoneus]